MKLVEMVKGLGLNDYEARIFHCLAENGKLPVSSISSIASVPRARVYDVLLSLEKKGLAVQHPGKPVEFSSFSLGRCVENIKSLRLMELKQEFIALDALTKELGKKLSIKEGVQENEVLLLNGKHNIYGKLAELISKAEKEVVICTTEENAIQKINELARHLSSARERGVKIHFRATKSKKNEMHLEKLKGIALLGDNELEARHALIDGKHALIFLDSGSEEKALLFENPKTVASLKK